MPAQVGVPLYFLFPFYRFHFYSHLIMSEGTVYRPFGVLVIKENIQL